MKKLLAFAAAALLLTGCQLKTATYADDQAIPLEEGQTDSLIMSVSLEYPVKGAPEEVIEKISHSILTTAFDLEEEPGEVIETARRYEDNLKDGYFNEYEDVKEVPAGMIIGMSLFALICVVTGLFPRLVTDFLTGPAANAALNPANYISSMLTGEPVYKTYEVFAGAGVWSPVNWLPADLQLLNEL